MLDPSQTRRVFCRALITCAVLLLAAGCPKSEGDQHPTPALSAATRLSGDPASAMAVLGKRLFFDASLSASGRMSCVSCHSPAHAYGPANSLAVQLGGPKIDRQGVRSVPSLRYVLNRTPIWSKEYQSNPAERLIDRDSPPTGGFGWDGRFNTLHEQATFPLLDANEMANANPTEVAARLQRTAYADEFRKIFGAQVFDDPRQAYAQALLAIERFELEDPSFRPYDSKYDDYLDGKVQLSDQEKRGLALFDDPLRGNCASCHIDRKGADGSHPLLTDYQFEALGVPRNPEIRANADRRYFDEGLCGPLRQDQVAETPWCGMFKTPSLRNVASRGAFFHNGRFHTLKDALRFYVQRDTSPRRWYPLRTDGSVDKFDDLPPPLRRNADVVDAPLTRGEGDAPAWTDADIDDVAVFLQTLNDRDVQTAAMTVVANRNQ